MFDSYCKKVLRNGAKDIQREYAYQNKHQVSLDEIEKNILETLLIDDNTAYDTVTLHFFGNQFFLKNERLATALLEISAEQREVILLFYFLGFNDREIGVIYKLSVGAVWYRRKKAINQLYKKITGDCNDA